MPKAFKTSIVSANDLFIGDVVYMNSGGGWTRKLSEAAIAHTPEEGDTLMGRAAPQQAKVVGPYLAEVALDDDGRPFPTHFREKFRTRGPSTRPDLGKQAANPERREPLAARGGI
jgi:hypothetical protein